jgi:hypothetical protein
MSPNENTASIADCSYPKGVQTEVTFAVQGLRKKIPIFCDKKPSLLRASRAAISEGGSIGMRVGIRLGKRC